MREASKMRAYCSEVLRFRKVLNLTSIADEHALMQRFIRPSLALAAWIPPEATRLLDLGSGMGVPGIPLLLVRPELTGVLVERRKKRAEFLRHVVRQLALNAVVYDQDIRSLQRLDVDVCVARAVADQDALLALFEPHLRTGGRAILPVPRASSPVERAHWRLIGEDRVHAGDQQLIRCYAYRPGGFT